METVSLNKFTFFQSLRFMIKLLHVCRLLNLIILLPGNRPLKKVKAILYLRHKDSITARVSVIISLKFFKLMEGINTSHRMIFQRGKCQFQLSFLNMTFKEKLSYLYLWYLQNKIPFKDLYISFLTPETFWYWKYTLLTPMN